MIDEMMQSDWWLQGVMLLGALVFALVMRFGLHNGGSLATLAFQGLIIASAIVVIGSAVHPSLFRSMYDQRSVMLIPAMMTLIYAVRDVFSRRSAKDRSNH